jgi:hypothetical protein
MGQQLPLLHGQAMLGQLWISGAGRAELVQIRMRLIFLAPPALGFSNVIELSV